MHASVFFYINFFLCSNAPDNYVVKDLIIILYQNLVRSNQITRCLEHVQHLASRYVFDPHILILFPNLPFVWLVRRRRQCAWCSYALRPVLLCSRPANVVGENGDFGWVFKNGLAMDGF